MNTNIASKYFSESYSVSRTRFRKAILHVGSRFEEFPIDQKDDNGMVLKVSLALQFSLPFSKQLLVKAVSLPILRVLHYSYMQSTPMVSLCKGEPMKIILI
jgi:hypothetical protein